jgi:spore germination cell wall hydrolase CwlJ-like protein
MIADNMATYLLAGFLTIVPPIEQEEEFLCMAEAIWFEYRGAKDYWDMEAIGHVILERTKDDRMFISTNTVCEVVSKPYAFSYRNEGIPKVHIRNERDQEAFTQALVATYNVLVAERPDITSGSNHYYNPRKANPKWAYSDAVVADNGYFGDHRYLRLEW